jgi:3-dehydro-L-gulonate 2-dehydrogenase
MLVDYQDLLVLFKKILEKEGFSSEKATKCAIIFANNSLDGVYSHGVNRFPVFVEYIREGLVKQDAEPKLIKVEGSIEKYDGQLGPGMLNASFCMDRSIQLSKENGLGCVAIRNTNHWMRGGTYGWQAADAGCIGICFTNTIANMPPWGGLDPRLGNNPFIIAVPRKEGHIVLDMAMTQYSFGKLQEYDMKNEELPFPGGYNENGELSTVPREIVQSKRTLPIGFWKGSGLSFMIDLLVSILSEGRSTASITDSGKEYGVSQVFICINQQDNPLADQITKQVIEYSKSGRPEKEGGSIYYPGERTIITRLKNKKDGIPVSDEIWKKINAL